MNPYNLTIMKILLRVFVILAAFSLLWITFENDSRVIHFMENNNIPKTAEVMDMINESVNGKTIAISLEMIGTRFELKNDSVYYKNTMTLETETRLLLTPMYNSDDMLELEINDIQRGVYVDTKGHESISYDTYETIRDWKVLVSNKWIVLEKKVGDEVHTVYATTIKMIDTLSVENKLLEIEIDPLVYKNLYEAICTVRIVNIEATEDEVCTYHFSKDEKYNYTGTEYKSSRYF